MTRSQQDTTRRLQRQEADAKAAIAAKQQALKVTQAKLRQAAQQARLAHQQVMGRLADEAGLATLALDTLQQAFTALGRLAQCPHALAQWVAETPLAAPQHFLAEGVGVRTAQEADNGVAPRDQEKECPLPRFSDEKR